MKWTPPWCSWVEGEYHPDPEKLEMFIDLTCTICGDKSRTICTQGRPRLQIARYGTMLHMHGKDMKKWDEEQKKKA